MIRKVHHFWGRIPRPAKAIVCIICSLALAALYYIALGSPTLNFEQEFRRAEKANLIGPSRILEILDNNCSDFDRMLVGETDYGICFFGETEITVRRGNNYAKEEMVYTFSYREKTGDITVIAAPNSSSIYWNDFKMCLPVYVFDAYPDAARAELELTITGSDTHVSNGEKITTDYCEHFTATAKRTGVGYFRFDLTAKEKTRLYALCLLSSVSGIDTYYNQPSAIAEIPGIVRLYDANGVLIIEKEFTIVSAIAAAHP